MAIWHRLPAYHHAMVFICIGYIRNIFTRNTRSLPLPEKLIPERQKHMKRVYNLHKKDVAAGFDGVFMPGASDRK